MSTDNKQKERLFYLDFVRAIAVLSIVLCHFNARYSFLYMNPDRTDLTIITWQPFNLFIGDLGVAVFFIISGAALMYTYDNELNLASFYKKRALAIYPMFYIAYLVVFITRAKAILSFNLSPVKWLFTLTGFDGYFSTLTSTYYILGEWFLGCIVLVYLVFPLLRAALKKAPVITWIVVLILYFLSVQFISIPNFNSSLILTVRIPEVLFGMTFVKYIKKSHPIMVAASVIVLLESIFFIPPISSSYKTTYIGISFFIVLVFISSFIKNDICKRICHLISKYSYAVFLTHHVIIDMICNHIPMESLNTAMRYMLFLGICLVIAVASFVLFEVHRLLVNWVMKRLK